MSKKQTMRLSLITAAVLVILLCLVGVFALNVSNQAANADPAEWIRVNEATYTSPLEFEYSGSDPITSLESSPSYTRIEYLDAANDMSLLQTSPVKPGSYCVQLYNGSDPIGQVFYDIIPRKIHAQAWSGVFYEDYKSDNYTPISATANIPNTETPYGWALSCSETFVYLEEVDIAYKVMDGDTQVWPFNTACDAKSYKVQAYLTGDDAGNYELLDYIDEVDSANNKYTYNNFNLRPANISFEFKLGVDTVSSDSKTYDGEEYDALTLPLTGVYTIDDGAVEATIASWSKYTNELGNGDTTDPQNYTAGYTSVIGAGLYRYPVVTLTGNKAGNYNLLQNPFELTIEKATITGEVTQDEWQYAENVGWNDKMHFEATDVVEGNTVATVLIWQSSYEDGGDTYWTDYLPAVSAKLYPGTYSCRVLVSGNDNYKETPIPFTLTISQAKVYCVLSSNAMTYNGTTQAPVATFHLFSTDGPSPDSYSYVNTAVASVTENDGGKNVGNYSVAFAMTTPDSTYYLPAAFSNESSGLNYSGLFTRGNPTYAVGYRITPADLGGSVSVADFTYGESITVPTIANGGLSVSGWQTGDSNALISDGNIKIEYAPVGNTASYEAVDNEAWSIDAPTEYAEGGYYIRLQVTSLANYTELTVVDTFNIEQKTLTFKWSIGGTEMTNEDWLDYISDDENPKYGETGYIPFTNTFTYTGTKQTPTVTFTNIGDDTVTITGAQELLYVGTPSPFTSDEGACIVAGLHQYNLISVSNSNYKIPTGGSQALYYAIEKKALTVTWAMKNASDVTLKENDNNIFTHAYDNTAYHIAVTVNGLVDADIARQATVDTYFNSQLGGTTGSTAVTNNAEATLAAIDAYRITESDEYNYYFVADSQAWSITAINITNASVAQDGALTYNGGAQTANVTTANATTVGENAISYVYSDELTGTYAAAVPAFTTAGEHTVYYTASAANHNDYAGTFTVTIGKKALHVSFTNVDNQIYSGSNINPTGAFDLDDVVAADKTGEAVNASKLSISFTGGSTISAGTYNGSPAYKTFAIDGDSTGNYVLTADTGYTVTNALTNEGRLDTFTILQKTLTFSWTGLTEQEAVYSRTEKSVTASISDGIVAGDEGYVAIANYSNNAKTAKGNYTAAVTSLGGGASGDKAANYTLTGSTNVTYDWAITAKPVSISAIADEMIYSGSALGIGNVSYNVIDGDEMSVTVTYDEVDRTNWTGTAFYAYVTINDGNYAVAENSAYAIADGKAKYGPYTIAKKEVKATIGAPSNPALVFNGSAKTIAAPTFGKVNSATGTTVITGYNGDNTNVTNDGFTVSFKLSNDDAVNYQLVSDSVNNPTYTVTDGVATTDTAWLITPAAVVVTLTGPASLVYSNSDKVVTGTYVDVNSDVQNATIAYIGDRKNVTQDGFTVAISIEDPNYSVGTGDGCGYSDNMTHSAYVKDTPYYITKVTPTFTITPVANTAEDLTYNKAGQNLIKTAGVVDYGTIEYRVGTTGAWGAKEAANAQNAGSYTVYYRVVGDSNINDVAEATLDAGIAKKDITISGIQAENKTYDGTTVATLNYDNVTFGGIIAGDTLTVTATGTFANADAGNDKTVTISELTLGGNDINNYVLANEGQQTGSAANIIAKNISGATINLGEALTYTGSQQTQEVASVVIGGLNATFDVSNNKQTNRNPDENYVLTVTGNGNFTGSATIEWNIAKAQAVITGVTGAANLVYNADDQALLSAGGSTTFGTIEYKLSDEDDEEWRGAAAIKAEYAGTYTINYRVVGTDNYDGANGSVEVTIAKKTIVVSAIADPKTYDGNTNVTFSNIEVGGRSNLEDDEDLYATIQGAFADANAGNNKTVNITSVTLTGDSKSNYVLSTTEGVRANGTLTATIAKAPLTITADDKTVEYGENAPAFTYSFDGFVNNETSVVLENVASISLSCSYVAQPTPGTYTAAGTTCDINVAGSVTADNYAISYEKGTLTVDKRALTLNINHVEVEYGKNARSYCGYTVAEGGIIDGADVLDNDNVYYYIDSFDENELFDNAVGDSGSISFDYNSAPTVESNNYRIGSVNNGTWTIVRKNVSSGITIEVGELTYNGAEQTIGITVKYGDIVMVKDTDYTVEFNSATAAGNYELCIHGIGNYTGDKTAEWSIAPRALEDDFITITSDLTYNGVDQTVGYTVTFGTIVLVKDTDYTVSETVSGSTDQGKMADSYTLTINGIGNYSGSASAEWSIGDAYVELKNTNDEPIHFTFDEDMDYFLTTMGIWQAANWETLFEVIGGAVIEGDEMIDVVNCDIYREEGNNVISLFALLTGDDDDFVAYGDYTGKWEIELVSANYDLDYELSESFCILIDPKPMTFTAANTEKTYGEEDEEIALVSVAMPHYEWNNTEGKYETVMNYVPENNLTEFAESVQLAFGREDGEDAGVYAIDSVYAVFPEDMFQGIDPLNYCADLVAGATYTINRKVVGLTWGNDALTYNGQAQAPAVTVTGKVGNDVVNVTVTGQATNANDDTTASYTATVTAISNTNYELPATNLTKVYTIAPMAVTFYLYVDGVAVNGNDATLTYDGQAHVFSLVAEGAGDEVITLFEEENVDAFGGAEVWIEAGAIYFADGQDEENVISNYVAAANQTFTYAINKKAITFGLYRDNVLQKVDNENVYDVSVVSNGSAHTFVMKASGTVGTEAINYRPITRKSVFEHTYTIANGEGFTADGALNSNYVYNGEAISVRYAIEAEVVTDETTNVETMTEIVDVADAKSTGVNVATTFAQAKAKINDQTEGEVAVELKIGDATIVFDEAAINAIGGTNAVLSVNVAKTEETIAAAVTANDKLTGAEMIITVTLGANVFTALDAEGKATVSVNFDKAAPKGTVGKVYYVDADGNKTDMNATFADGKVTFKTNHFSDYIVVFEKSGLSGGAIAGIVIGCVVFVAGVVVAVLFLLKKKKGGKAGPSETVASEAAAE